MTAAELESKVLAMESEVAELKERFERAEIDAAVRRSDEQIARGEAVPIRQAMDSIRRRHPQTPFRQQAPRLPRHLQNSW